MRDNEIDALINLLEDPDQQVYAHVKQKLMDFGPEVIPVLESAWENFSFGVLFQNRIEELIHSIQFQHVTSLLIKWKSEGAKDLLEGMLIVSRFQYPDLDQQKVMDYLDLLEKDVWLELNNDLTGLEKIRVFNHIFFDIHGFKGNTTNYHAPQNSYISDVLDVKKGTPISLSALYIILAERLQLPVFGVNLPRHFIVCYLDWYKCKSKPIHQIGVNDVLFYVNPFNKGSFLSKKDLHNFLKQLKIEPEDKFLLPCNNLDIILRVLHNLQYSYEKMGYLEKFEEIKNLTEIIKPQ